jgi:hypothetical protein
MRVLSQASIARIVHAVAGEGDFDEVIWRTAFNILIGNGDAHLKNWSLTYPDGIHVRLSPRPGDRTHRSVAYRRRAPGPRARHAVARR